MTSPARQLVDALQALDAWGFNAGTSGNLSVRSSDGLLITPSAVPSQMVRVDDIVALDMDGKVRSAGVPSSEWRIHRDIYLRIPEAFAVVHTHSVYATALASLREELPAFHYVVAKGGGSTIRCADYAPYGTQELSDAVSVALVDRRACLMANHGMLAYGPDLEAALSLTMEIEHLCRQYLIARSAGTPVLLTDEQIEVVRERFRGYGLPEE